MSDKKKTYWNRFDSLYSMIVIIYTLADLGALDKNLNVKPGYELKKINELLRGEFGYKSYYKDEVFLNADIVRIRAMIDAAPSE